MKNKSTQNIAGAGRFRRVRKPGKLLPFARILIAGIILLLGAAGLMMAQEAPPATGQIGNVLGDQTSPLSAQPPESASLFFAILKVAGSLGLVLGVMLLIVMLIKKLGLTGPVRRSGSLINVLETRMLAPKKYVAVLEIAKQYMVVGITDQQINLLARLDSSDSLATQPNQAGQREGIFAESPFSTMINKTIAAASYKRRNESKNVRDGKDNKEDKA